MKRKKILFILALLLATVQGAWAQNYSVWDGYTLTEPTYLPYTYSRGLEDAHYIRSASDLAYIRARWDEYGDYFYWVGSKNDMGFKPSKIYENKTFSEMTYYLECDIDMGDTPFTPLGPSYFYGTFYGQGHTIRIKIDGATENYQGLFSCIGSSGKVQDLTVTGDIYCKDSRLVGGICGYNNGTIENCWVRANVKSDWVNPWSVNKAKVGGICGENDGKIEYCGVTGNVTNDDAYVGGLVGCNDGELKHGVFYGTRTSAHWQYNKYVGSNGTEEELHDSFTNSEIRDYLNKNWDWRRYKNFVQGILCSYSLSTTQQGEGIYSVNREQIWDPWFYGGYSGNTFPGETIRLIHHFGDLNDISVKDADGNGVAFGGNPIDGYTFTMPHSNVNIHVVYNVPACLNHAGTESDPYTIGSTDDWNDFVRYVNGGCGFNGKFIQLANDISIETMAGTDEAKSFQGTFDGNGHTLTFNKGTAESPFAEEYCAPFRQVKNATIKNLHVAGTIYTSEKFAAGFVGESHEYLSLTGCRSSVTINSSVSGDGSHGGFVAVATCRLNGWRICNIDGCLFDGSFATTAGTTNCGGFIGWGGYSKIYIKNSLIKPGSVDASMLEKTFARYSVSIWYQPPTYINSYYIQPYGDPQGKQARSVTGGENVNFSVSDQPTATYSVSGITVYDNELAYDGTYYSGAGNVVNLTLSNTLTPEEGIILQYSAGAGTLTGTENSYTLTMPDADVTIDIKRIAIDWADEHSGDEDDPYLIYSKEQLNLLAERVNKDNTYKGKYFKLMNDIAYSHETAWDDATSTEENFKPIGRFEGTFDGNGHTISGIRIYRPDGNYLFLGLFGNVYGGSIHDLTLADTRITGYNAVGGIVGENMGGTIQRCNVTSTVAIHAIHAVQAEALYHGGIVGQVALGSVSYCTSAATLTTDDTSQSSAFGAICGYNAATISNNLAIGATVPAAKDNQYGAICGYNNRGNLEDNYYVNCTVAGTANATDVGCQADDVTTDNGATPAYAITTGNAENFSIEPAGAYIGSGSGITFYDTGFGYDDVLYAAEDQEVSLTLDASRNGYTPTYQASAGTLTGTENPYTLTMPAEDVTISVADWTVSGLTTDEDGNYLITSTADWNAFCEYVADGTNFSGKTLKLTTDDITVTASNMVGDGTDHVFRGTFDGAGHTLTVSIGTAEEPFAERFCGPFCYIYGATIRNLKTTGHIYTANINDGGVVGRNGTGRATLENVTSDVAIHSSINDRGYHGGLVGYAINASFIGCAFTGSLLGEGIDHIGGLLGQKSDTEGSGATFTNCLFAPSEFTASPYCSYPFAAGAQYLASIGDDCYYTTPVGGEQGTRIYTAAVAGEINKQLTAIDGKTYYMPCTVSGVQEEYLYTGSDIEVVTPAVTAADGTVLKAATPTVTAADGTVLTPDTDYTVSISPDPVKEKGTYTLTVSGQGSYSGSKSFSFVVGDYPSVTSTTTALATGSYKVYDDVTVAERIVISGDVSLYLGEGTILRARKGIELAAGNSLTIYGPGALVINNCDAGKSGIGAARMGTLTIQGGQLDIAGAEGAAGIGSDAGAAASGNLTLVWTDASDYVKCSSYSLADGILFSKQFVINEEQAVATAANIGGQRIVPAVVLADTGDNGTTLADNNGKRVAAALSGRTLYKDGDWNTVCLPFDMDIATLKGAEARTLTTASISGTTLNLTFGDPVEELKAGTPYIIKWTKADDYVDNDAHNMVSPVFEGVTIDAAAKHDYDNAASGDLRVRFLGTYKSTSFAAEDRSILFMGAGNTLYYPTTGASIGAQRAYFKIGDGTAPARQLTDFSIDFGESEASGIISVSVESGSKGVADDWFTLDGRQLQGRPSRAGVYINNGAKVVVK